MFPSARVKATPLQWLMATMLVAIVLYAPAAVASSVTAPEEPVAFLTQPWHGWSFAGTVLKQSFSAKAASPGAALETAKQVWHGGNASGTSASGIEAEPVPESVKLLFLPGTRRVTFAAITPRGERRVTVDPSHALAWEVNGHYPTASQATGVIGLIDFVTGEPVWDVRTQAAPKGATA